MDKPQRKEPCKIKSPFANEEDRYLTNRTRHYKNPFLFIYFCWVFFSLFFLSLFRSFPFYFQSEDIQHLREGNRKALKRRLWRDDRGACRDLRNALMKWNGLNRWRYSFFHLLLFLFLLLLSVWLDFFSLSLSLSFCVCVLNISNGNELVISSRG